MPKVPGWSTISGMFLKCGSVHTLMANNGFGSELKVQIKSVRIYIPSRSHSNFHSVFCSVIECFFRFFFVFLVRFSVFLVGFVLVLSGFECS